MDVEGGDGIVEPEDQMDIKYEDFPYGVSVSPTPAIIDPLSPNVTSEIDHPVEPDQPADVVNVGELFVSRAEFEEMSKEVRELKAKVTRLEADDKNGSCKSVQKDDSQKKDDKGPEMKSLAKGVNGPQKENPPKGTKGPQMESLPDALMTANILAEIFSYLDLRGLKSARLVCTKWAEASTPRFLTKARMTVSKPGFFFRTMNHFETAFPPPPSDRAIFPSLKIEDMTVSTGMMNRPWIRAYGPGLTHVKLGRFASGKPHRNHFIPLDNLQELLLNVCPNLKELVLRYNWLEPAREPLPSCPRRVHLQLLELTVDATYPECAASALLLVFSCVASLKALRLRCDEHIRGDPKTLDEFNGLRDSPEAQKVLEGLEELDIPGWLASINLIDWLAKVEFRNLKVLTLGSYSYQDWSDPITLATSISGLLTKVRSGLEKLSLGFCGRAFNLETFPELPNLKSLRSYYFKSMCFMLKTPKLEELELIPLGGLAGLKPILMLQGPHGQLKTLTLPCATENPGEFGMMSNYFPNLEKLVWLLEGNGPLAMDCLYGLTNLEYLKILDLSVYFDAWGRPANECHDLKTVVTALPNLPALETLYLRTRANLTGEMFTSGFFKCLKLKKLDLLKAKLAPDEDWDTILKSGHGMQIIVPVRTADDK